MKVFVQSVMVWILMGICLGSPVFSNENPRLASMVSELEAKIEDADKRMIAHPSFINELRELAHKYKSLLREVYFKDGFDDGNYSANPRWMVKSGGFEVTEGYLTSSVFSSFGPGSSSRNQSLEQEAVGILLDTIFKTPKTQSQPESGSSDAKADPAVIFTKIDFPPAFELTLRFKSSKEAKMDILLLGTDKLTRRYRLTFYSEHSETHPIELIREGGSRNFIVGASNKFPVVNDGAFHTLTWKRLTSGEMDVYIDRELVLRTYEAYYRDKFTGLALVNNSGSFKWDEIEISKPSAPGPE